MTSSLEADGFHITGFNEARPFSSFLPGIAGEYGKPMWVFYTNRGQCISSFGVRDRNGAMLEFHPANKAYALTPLLGFRSFFRFAANAGTTLHEPFLTGPTGGTTQRLCVRAEEIEIEELHPGLGLRMRVVYFTLPGENLPVLARQVTLENTGAQTLRADVLDGLPQIVPWGLEEKLLKQMSRTMEAFAEVRHADEALPFFKLKVEPSDKPEMQSIDGGFFAFTLRDGEAVPVLADPDLVFGSDTSLRTPLPFARGDHLDPRAARHDTLTGCAFASLAVALEPGASTGWVSYFGQAPDWGTARDFRQRVAQEALYVGRKRSENTELISNLSARFALIAGPAQLDPYTRQAFLDNTLRGGQPVVVNGPRGPRVFHSFTRKHGDMERDYNVFEVAPTYWSQGNANFRDVNQNRRSENFTFPEVDASNIETFFGLIQLDGNNPLVIQAEKFLVPPEQLALLWQDWPAGNTPAWASFLAQPFSPGQLLEALLRTGTTAQTARPWFDCILGRADKIQGAAHGEGYWVDHWIYNLDLIDSYATLYPDRLRALLIERCDFGYFDNEHIVQPRERKYVLRPDGSVRQLHAVVKDADKARLIAQRTEQPHAMRAAHGLGAIYQTTLLAKILNLLAIKASLFDPFGIGLEMEADKPGWCDALNGLPGLVGSSTHEAFALQRGVGFVRRTLQQFLAPDGAVSVAREVTAFVRSLSNILTNADGPDFFPTWQQLATRREAFRAETRLGVSGDEVRLPAAEILQFLASVDQVLSRGLARAVDSSGLPISYYTHEIAEFDLLPAAAPRPGDEPTPVFVQARRFVQKPVAAFLEGAVHALRSSADAAQAQTLYRAVRQSSLFDTKLGMYRVNAPLDAESFEIGRSKIFSPGWLENESIFLHMHYKFMLETLRSGLAHAFYEDLKRGLVAFHSPEVYGRSPLENSSFIASSRFPDPKVHGVGFVARLSGATAEWISMVLHMGLGAEPFRVVDGALRFEPRPVLADWLFTPQPSAGFGAGSFGLRLFGKTWIVYANPKRRHTFGQGAVAPVSFELRYADGTLHTHAGGWLPAERAMDLRNGKLLSVVIGLDDCGPATA
jgi:hypothetical protein